MDPSEVRTIVLDQHIALSQRMDAINRLLVTVRTDTAQQAELSTALRGFVEALFDHMDTEDRLLEPALWDADAWGDVRTALLHKTHEGQRDRLRALVAQLDADTLDLAALRSAAADLVAEVREDMAKEDRDLLHPNILRDDVVSMDAAGG